MVFSEMPKSSPSVRGGFLFEQKYGIILSRDTIRDIWHLGMVSELMFTILIYSAMFCLGLIYGSFLNSWAWRTKEKVCDVGGRSVCVRCKRQLRWYDNIPLLSYMVLKGRCRFCKGKISWRYPLIELGVGIIFALVVFYLSQNSELGYWSALRPLILVGFLSAIAIFDLLYGLIPTEVAWAGVFAGVGLNFFTRQITIQSILIGAVVGGGFFAIQYALSRGRWIGGGDIRLGIMMGAWLGWPGIITGLGISYVLGAFVAILLLVLKKKKWAGEIPFGPYLAVGTVVAMIVGEKLVRWYLRIIGT
ncbi:MAG: Type 4 prepilin-like protein leader peptide-processing enzyme PilD [Candidatus Magasanikbacteria bacterium GW2011_GWA2_46_17]|uniref:Type 4 prepilin-like protein leader peptide-processing enzyme PilD n=1 Tax=Candidatus Magasanikbacteria bacterium GW2011_GWA2_46_17 TaxID=1619042 RepID=A0A0G1NYS7_9BACT|nr:MAG: Type 4 prepilin-like protein leader peptide-processing enzyme PilD [Candidatus Magasanikbacteria bacterium GW2011_GWA2_46_17]